MYPKNQGYFEDTIVCCIKENPEPVQFKVACYGVRPELELDKKQLHFEKVLLHRWANASPLPQLSLWTREKNCFRIASGFNLYLEVFHLNGRLVIGAINWWNICHVQLCLKKMGSRSNVYCDICITYSMSALHKTFTGEKLLVLFKFCLYGKAKLCLLEVSYFTSNCYFQVKFYAVDPSLLKLENMAKYHSF